MLKASRRTEPAVVDYYDDARDYDEEPARGRSKDLIALVLAAIAACGILVNALFLQAGPHPAPIFSARPVVSSPAATTPAPVAKTIRSVGSELTGAMTLPRPRPVEPEAAKAEPAAPKAETIPARSRLEVVADIQKELTKRGFYDGAADGVYGPKTDAAIRDFEQSAGVKHGSEPNEALLRAITQSNAKAKPVTTAVAPRNDPIAELIAPSPSKRILSVQRALSDFGYGQIKPTGVLDTGTQDAISQFERAKKMPVTGQISPRLIRELAAVTGRPLE